MKTKFISALISASMIVSMLPMSFASAADYTTPADWMAANSTNLAAADGVSASNANSSDEANAIDGSDSTNATWIIMGPNNLNQFFTIDLGASKKVAGISLKNIKHDRNGSNGATDQSVSFYGSNSAIDRASGMAAGATLLGSYTVTNSNTDYNLQLDSASEYRYIYMASHGSQLFNITLGEFYIWSEPCDVFGDWTVNDETANVSFTVPVDYMDPSAQQDFTMRLTKYDEEGKMLAAPVDTVIESTETETQDLTASITLGITDCVQAALFNEEGELLTQYSYGFDGFNAEKGTAATFEEAFGYSITETSATVEGKSVSADDIITVEAIFSEEEDEEAAFDGKTFSDMYYVAETRSNNGYSVTVSFEGAATGTYYIRTTRDDGETLEYRYRKFSFVDPEDRQACIDAFLADGADFGECIDNAVDTLGIIAADSLIDRDSFYEEDFAPVAEDIIALMADDEVDTEELLTMLNTATVVYALSKGETEVMDNDEYAALVKDGGTIENYVGEELGYSLAATVTTESNLTLVTNLGESGIITFEFTEDMDTSLLTEDTIIITKDGEAAEAEAMEITSDAITYYVTAFEPNSSYVITFKSGDNGCKTADGQKKMLNDVPFELTTGDILDVEYVEGKVLKNIAKNKPILNVEDVTASNGVSASVIVDGNRSGSESRITPDGADPIIDLGSYYMPVYMRIDYYGGSACWWNCDGVTYRGSAYPVMTDEGTPAEDGLDGENGVSLYVSEPTSTKLDSTLNSSEYLSFKDLGYSTAIEAYGPMRYVQLQITGDSAMLYEFELYAYVDSEIGALSVNNEEFAADEDYTFEAPVTENAGEKTYGMVINAYDENGITTKAVANTVSVSNGKITASITDIPVGSIGVTAMVVDDISTMNQLCNALTIGEAVPASDTVASSGLAINANTQKISINAGASTDVLANSHYAVTVIDAEGFTGEASTVFGALTDAQLQESLVFSSASRVADGVVFDIDDLPEGKYYIQVVANTFDGSKRAAKQFKQAIISGEATGDLIEAIMDSEGNALKTAVNNAVYVEEAISTDSIAEKANFAAMLNDERFIALLGYTRDMIYPEGTDTSSLTLSDITDVINAASAVYALDKEDAEKATTLLASYGAILGDSYIAAADSEKLTDVFAEFNSKITSGATLSEVIEWSCLLSFIDGALDDDVAEAFETYEGRLGIDISYASDRKISLTRAANYFERGDLSKIYGETAFKTEFEDAVQDAKAAKNNNNGGGTGPVTGGGDDSVDSFVKDDTPTPTQKPTPTVAPVVSESGFGDMQGYAWADEAVASLKEKGIIAGNENGDFEPTRNVTRAEFVKMLIMAADIRVDEGAYMSLMDVSEDSWYFPYVKIAYSRNICRGVDNFHFNPHGNITRQDMAVMLQNFLSYLEVGANGEVIEFTDGAKISDYAQGAVETVAKAGLINGFDDGSFRPHDSTRRVDAAMVISRVIDMLG